MNAELIANLIRQAAFRAFAGGHIMASQPYSSACRVFREEEIPKLIKDLMSDLSEEDMTDYDTAFDLGVKAGAAAARNEYESRIDQIDEQSKRDGFELVKFNERLHRMAADLERTQEHLQALDHNATLRLDRLSSENENLTNRIHDPVGFQQGYDKGYADCEVGNQPEQSDYDAGYEQGYLDSRQNSAVAEQTVMEIRKEGYCEGFNCAKSLYDKPQSRNIECAYDAGREHGRKDGLEECKKREAHSYEAGRQTGYEDGHREGYFRGREELMAEIHSLAEQPVEMAEPEPCCESEVKCCC